ncbi:hypothetical protein [Aestuariimicrobium ganziense]|uniref:hypothetical protein n=1 Tax=Aestuariimicrobium ganziense TaxID=2773677 RepID=UPI001942F3F1|nr:hypothetical protein [Aestuariimicrobium ganziense]
MSQQSWDNQPSPWSRQGSDNPAPAPEQSSQEAWRNAPPPQPQPSAPPASSQPSAGSYPQYPTQQPGAGGYQQAPSPYAANPYQPYAYPTGPVDDGTSKKGALGLGMALSALVISLLLSWFTAKAYVDLMQAQGTAEMTTENLPPEQNAMLMRAGMGVLGQVLPTILGILGLIFSVQAMKIASQRSKGIVGLIVAIGAPIVSFIFWIVLIMQGAAEYF